MNIFAIPIAIVSSALIISYLWIGVGPALALTVGLLLAFFSAKTLLN